MKYPYGDTVAILSSFIDLSGDPADPTTVTVTVEAPDGTETTPAAANTAVGSYRTLVTGDQAGIWYYRVVGEGNDTDAVFEGSFCIEETSL